MGHAWLLLGNILYIFAYGGLVGNLNLAAKVLIFAPLSTSTKHDDRAKRRRRVYHAHLRGKCGAWLTL